MESGKKNLLIEAVSVLLAALIAAEAVIYFRAAIPRYADLIIAGVFLYLPIMFVLWRKDKFEDVALEHLNLGQSILWFALAVIIILPVFYFVAGLGAIKILKWRFDFSFPPSIFNLALSQLLLVSIPEEWLFRGYLQGRFNQVWSSNWKIFSAPAGPSLFIVAALFALAHFALLPAWDRLLVFFPALVFGWLREKTGSLAAPVLFHLAANLTFITFQISFVR